MPTRRRADVARPRPRARASPHVDARRHVHARDAPDDDARDARPDREPTPLDRRRADDARVDDAERARARRHAAPSRAAAPTDDDDDGGGAARRRRGDGGARARAMRSRKIRASDRGGAGGAETRAARGGGRDDARTNPGWGFEASRAMARWRGDARGGGRRGRARAVEKKRAHRAGDAGDDARARKGWEARENEKAIGLALGGEDGEDAGARGARAMDARGIWSTDDVLMFYRA